MKRTKRGFSIIFMEEDAIKLFGTNICIYRLI